MPSAYYLQSVELGKQFQLNNSSWAGHDSLGSESVKTPPVKLQPKQDITFDII